MDLMLNAVEDDGSGGEGSPVPPPPPPAFAMPVSRISASGGVPLSSILSAASPQTPNDAPAFQLPMARGGLASLMNSPREPIAERDEAMESARGESPARDEAVVMDEGMPEKRDKTHDVEMEADDAEDGDEMDDDASENEHDESSMKRRRGYSVASEGSVATPPPPTAASVQSPASVAINADALVLADAELVELKAALQLAVQQYLSAEAKASAPQAKRRKGKQASKKRASQAQADASAAVSDSLEAIEQCISKVHEKITVDLMDIAVLRDVVRMNAVFLGVVNESDPLYNASSPSIKTALEALQQKPVHMLFASTIRRVMLSVSDDSLQLVLGDVLDWILSSDTQPLTWAWLFAFFAQDDSSAVVEFFVHFSVFQQPRDAERETRKLALAVLEELTANRTAEIVDAVNSALHQIAGANSVDLPMSDALNRLVSIGLESPTILKAVDGSFQWLVTKELVQALWRKISAEATYVINGTSEQRKPSLYSKLLQLIDERSAELDNSTFQILLLLQQLCAVSDASQPSDLVTLATKFHTDVLRIAQHQSDLILMRSVHRRIPYATQTCIELLDRDQQSPTSAVRLESWKAWLTAVAVSISRRDITDRLLQSDLASSRDSSPVPVESICELICSVVEPPSPEFVVLLREIADWLRHLVASHSGRIRLLCIFEQLVEVSARSHASDLTLVPLQLDDVSGSDNIDQIIEAFSQMSPCQESWSQLEQWRSVSGAEQWEYLLDLTTGELVDDNELSARALLLLAKTPLPSLEDPLWQFRCIRKLTNMYFHSLRRYRASIIDLEETQEARREWRKQLKTIQSIVSRVYASNGGVAHYPSSVSSTFVSLWLDLLFTTASATSVPTHFPSSTKGGNITLTKLGSVSTSDRRGNTTSGDEQVIIRSERTISSKCTNLQSSQVITKHTDTLIYRKALDETWERELHAAVTCSLLATKVLTDVVLARAPVAETDKSERRIKVLVDMLLERASPCCGAPSDDVYKEILPNRSNFDVDLRVEQWLNHFPAFLPLLRLVIDHGVSSPMSTHSVRLVSVIKSALVVLVGHWNSVKGELNVENMDVPPYMRNQNQLALSCELMRILRASGWLPEPLARTAELLPLTTPADIRGILFSCWFFLADHPPSITQNQSSASANGSSQKMPIEFYLLPVRKALHRNIHKVGAKYASFMC